MLIYVYSPFRPGLTRTPPKPSRHSRILKPLDSKGKGGLRGKDSP
jgi:hypothetical protein